MASNDGISCGDDDGIEVCATEGFVQENLEELAAIQTAALAEVQKESRQRSRSRSPVEKSRNRSQGRDGNRDRGDRGRDRGGDRRRDRRDRGGGGGRDVGRRRPTYTSIPGAKRNKIINYDCCVFISNIEYNVTWQELKDVLKRHVGDVGYVELFTNTDGSSKGCAFVEFKNRDDAKKAVSEMDRFEIHSRKLVIKEDIDGRHSEKYFRQREAENKAKSVLTPQLLQQLNLDPSNLCDTVFVANLSYEVTWRKLKDVFRMAGAVERVEIMEEKGKSRGMGTVQYDTILAAVNAICMFDGQMLFDRRMVVRMDKEKVRDGRPSKEPPPRPPPLPSGLGSIGPSIESLSTMGGNDSGGSGFGGNMGGQGLGGGGLGGGMGGGMGGVGGSGLGLGLGNLGGLSGLSGLTGGSGGLAGNLPAGLGQNLSQNLGQNLGQALGQSLSGGGLGGNLGGLGNSGLGGVGSGLSGLGSLGGLGGSGGSLGLGNSDLGRSGNSNFGGIGGLDLGSSNLGGGQGLLGGLGGLGGLGDLDRDLMGNSGGFGGGLGDRDFMNDDRDRDRRGRDFGRGRDRFRDRDRDRGRDHDRSRGGRNSGGGEGAGANERRDKGTPKKDGTQIFVRNLPFSFSWQNLKDLFKDIGNVMFATVRADDKGRSFGFGTVRFENQDEALMAINLMNGHRVEGRNIEVTLDRY